MQPGKRLFAGHQLLERGNKFVVVELLSLSEGAEDGTSRMDIVDLSRMDFVILDSSLFGHQAAAAAVGNRTVKSDKAGESLDSAQEGFVNLLSCDDLVFDCASETVEDKSGR